MELERIIRIKANTLNAINIMNSKCAVVGCDNNAKQIHHIRKLEQRLRDGVISMSGSHVLQGWKGLKSALDRKQVSLCITCHIKADKGEITPDDFDPKFIFNINKEI